MARSAEKAEKIMKAYEEYAEIFNTLAKIAKEIADGKPEMQACREHGINHNNFRRLMKRAKTLTEISADPEGLSEKLQGNQFATWKDKFMSDLCNGNDCWVRPDFDELFERVTSQSITPRAKEIITLYYKEDMTLDEIGAIFSLTRESIRQTIVKSLRRMRNKQWINLFLYGNEGESARKKALEAELKQKEYLISQLKMAAKFANQTDDEQFYNLVVSNRIEELDFSVRVYNCLRRAGIKTIKDLCELKPCDLDRIRNLGIRGKQEIIEKLDKLMLPFGKLEQ